MEKLKLVTSKVAAFVGNNKKPIGIASVVFVIIVVWLLHRDGIKPKESTGEITITTSSGEVIRTVPEQTETPEKQKDENM
jgi:hypothetical protein